MIQSQGMKTWGPKKTETQKETKRPGWTGRSRERDQPQTSERETLKRRGGEMTISPPANVKLPTLKEVKRLAYGIDMLVLSIDIKWSQNRLFIYLEKIKELAQKNDDEYPGFIMNEDNSDKWFFNIRPHGSGGYDWLLNGHEFSLKIGNWKEPILRPSIIAEIRSETLWNQGPEWTINRIIDLIKESGGVIETIKPSRVDLCVDILVPGDFWSFETMKFCVKRASEIRFHYYHKQLTGVSIGKGNISARIYDKLLEIRQKSRKFWMYTIWGMDKVPKGKKILRIEFQLRRETLRELKINKYDDLFENIENVWAYCTRRWLKFEDNPGKHHTQRSTIDWWKVVQEGFRGMQNPEPSIRSKALKIDMKQLARQAYGQLTSLEAAHLEEMGASQSRKVDIYGVVETFLKELKEDGKGEEDLEERLELKRAKYHRAKHIKEKENGFNKATGMGKEAGR